MVKLGEVIRTITPPKKIQKAGFGKIGMYPIIDQSQDEIAGWTDDSTATVNVAKPVVIFGDHTCSVKYTERPFVQGADGIKILETSDSLQPRFLFYWLKTFPIQSEGYKRHFSKLVETVIPLPPVEIQRQIVAELDGYRKIIEGARQVIANYKPTIKIDPKWPKVKLGEVAQVIAGQSPPGDSYNDTGTGTPFYQGKTEFGEMFIGAPKTWTTDPQRFAEEGDILMSVRAPVGPVNLAAQRICIGRGLAAIKSIDGHLLTAYAFYVLRSMEAEITGDAGAVFASINRGDIEKIGIVLPPLAVQREIVAELEAERAMVEANRKLVEIFEKKIQTTLARVWGEETSRASKDTRHNSLNSGNRRQSK